MDPINLKFDRSFSGQMTAEELQKTLALAGISSEDVMIRFFDKGRVEQISAHGTDRENPSHSNNLYDEEIWMKKLNLEPKQVTYVSCLKPHTISELPDLACVIYHKKALHKIGPHNNGFHVFLCQPRDAVIGIMHDNGSVALGSGLSNNKQRQTPSP